jgi:hypothetical protein
MHCRVYLMLQSGSMWYRSAVTFDIVVELLWIITCNVSLRVCCEARAGPELTQMTEAQLIFESYLNLIKKPMASLYFSSIWAKSHLLGPFRCLTRFHGQWLYFRGRRSLAGRHGTPVWGQTWCGPNRRGWLKRRLIHWRRWSVCIFARLTWQLWKGNKV